MNKKGFTTIELILTIAIVVVIMGTITSVTYTYRDRSNYEEFVTDGLNYKNNITKIIYDDILDVRDNIADSKGKVIEIKEDGSNYKFITDTSFEYNLAIINSYDKKGIKYGASGSELEYIIPNSSLVTFKNISLTKLPDDDPNIYRLDIVFEHARLKDGIKLHFIVSK